METIKIDLKRKILLLLQGLNVSLEMVMYRLC